VLTAELARASKKAQRYLRRYKLSRADREDILQDALLWCWEHRDNYSLTTSLDTWFVNAVRHSYERWLRIEKRESSLKGE
jgi:DNA-directed RNA polymerase specialized sigma24 family protein